jgi:hypothetical protein
MLTPSTRLRLQSILARISRDEPVSLQERIELQKHADRNATVAGWLRQARRRRAQTGPLTGLDRLLDDLNLSAPFPSDEGPGAAVHAVERRGAPLACSVVS